MGSMTGRAAGYCAGSGMPGSANPSPGRGFGMGFGRSRGFGGRGFAGGRRGWRHWFYATGQPGWMRFGHGALSYQEPDRDIETQALKNQAEALQSELDLVKKRLGEIESIAAPEGSPRGA
jgi:hypothetical protein